MRSESLKDSVVPSFMSVHFLDKRSSYLIIDTSLLRVI